MDIVGIICEYNPFHNGHIYHLEKVKELFPNSLIILVMSGNFTQRGIPSMLNKWEKTEIALEYGIDLVVELPFVFATQSADIFAHGTISILKELQANYLVFGSESNDVSYLEKLADISLHDDHYQKQVKTFLKEGINYPTALSKAFSNTGISTPNDLLGLSYIKEIKKQNASIQPISILRTNSYHDTKLNTDISSATSIRKAVLEKKDFQNSVPDIVFQRIKKHTFQQEDYFPFLKYKILTETDLSIYQTVEEGIEHRIKKYILESSSWEELVTHIKTKRYTYNKINRMLIHILCGFTKEMAKEWKNISYLRVLGFSKRGQAYLNHIKKDISIPLITTFSKGKDDILYFEMQTTSVYASILDISKQNAFIKQEYQQKPIQKE